MSARHLKMYVKMTDGREFVDGRAAFEHAILNHSDCTVEALLNALGILWQAAPRHAQEQALTELRCVAIVKAFD